MSTAEFEFAKRISVLFVGDSEWHEFQPACEELSATTQLSCAREAGDAARQLESGDAHVDLIVVAQIRPGQVSPAKVHALRTLAPLARIVGLFGSWCEGESRTGSPWPAIPRL